MAILTVRVRLATMSHRPAIRPSSYCDVEKRSSNALVGWLTSAASGSAGTCLDSVAAAGADAAADADPSGPAAGALMPVQHDSRALGPAVPRPEPAPTNRVQMRTQPMPKT